MQPVVLLSVAGAGALGALSRYLLTLLLRTSFDAQPLPIAIVNMLGCFGFGLVFGAMQERVSGPVAIAVLTGFFGAFTTFSAFALDGYHLLVDRRFGWFVLNLLLQNVGGLAALWFGITLTESRA